MTSNPYVNQDLKFPLGDWESVRRFTGTFRPDDGKSSDIDSAPFERYVDLWWMGMCLGVQEGRRQPVEQWHSFVTGVVLSSDPWRIRQMELLALAETGGVEVLGRPAEVLMIANEYAAAGIATLLDTMAGNTNPIWAVSALVRSLVPTSESD